MKVNIGIAQKEIDKINELLSVTLSDEMTLYIKTRKFHWNVYGESFMELHKLFEDQYKQLENDIDEIAERINKLGSKTIGTMKEFMKYTTLSESPGKYTGQKEMLKELLNDHETIISQLRKNIESCDKKYHDASTTDFLIKLLQQHETTAWVLRRYLG